MKRAGFTMIELIFVIVILGILAAVAIPKLAATRTDASISKMASNLQTVIKDVAAYSTAQGAMVATDTWGDVTDVPLFTTAGGTTSADTTVLTTAVYLNAGSTANVDGCYTVDMTDLTDANLTVISIASTTATSAACVGAKIITDRNMISSTSGITKSFAGANVVY